MNVNRYRFFGVYGYDIGNPILGYSIPVRCVCSSFQTASFICIGRDLIFDLYSRLCIMSSQNDYPREERLLGNSGYKK